MREPTLGSSDIRAVTNFVTGVAALYVFIAGFYWGTRASGGADSYGYISQASLWARGNLVIDQPIARTMPWPDADWTFAPLGYRPGLEPGTIVPIYPSGLPIVMAILQMAGGPPAVFLAVPLLGAMAAVAAAGLASKLSSPAAGAIAALLLASRPIWLFSVMWPMSDVPTAAWWGLALVLTTGTGIGSAAGSGVAAALAILTRPNLVAVALAPTLYLCGRVWQGGADRRRALVRLAIFAALTALGSLAVAVIHTELYGSPFNTGYGHMGEVFSGSSVQTNVVGFVLRPLRFEPMLVGLAVAGIVFAFRCRDAELRRTLWLLTGAAGLVLASYAFYGSFLDWWYLRLLLPAYPAVAALAAAGTVGIAQFAPHNGRSIVLVILSSIVVVTGLREARDRGVFHLQEAESRYEAVGRFVKHGLPPNAAFFAFQHSGSLRTYADRLTVRFDVLLPEWFDTAITKLRARGYRPYFVVEGAENALFKARFEGVSPLGRIDWPPVAEMRGPVLVQIFDPADRGRWRTGQPIATRPIPP